ncbi:MAG: hypothetical protein KA020_15880 [Planctomycetes bacterium]|nr:hypothetical protein [Planctomycetota bacterium]
MAKGSGLGSALFLDGFDLSGDVGAVNTIAGGNSPFDITGIDKLAVERLGGRRDGNISFNAFFNPTATVQEHARLSTLPRTDVQALCRLTTTPGTPALGDWAACLVAKQANYDPARGADGSLLFTIDLMANGYGLEWGQMLTAGKRQDTSATTPTTGLDDLVAPATTSAFGATVYVQLFSFTGTSVTFTLRDAAIEGTYAAVTGGAGSAMTALGVQRFSTSATQSIRRYLSIGTSGTFTEATFAVAVVRHLTATI